MKYVLVIPDGLGDNPLKKLGGKTPLEAAETPNMDALAKRGLVGLSQNIPAGFIPGTDIGCMSVFGYDPRKFFTGRGPLEAAELGLELKKGELAFRCNLVTTEGDVLKDFCADHISTDEAKILLDFLNKSLRPSFEPKFKIKFKFFSGKGTGYRNLMICTDAKGELGKIVCTPPHDIMGKHTPAFLPKGKGSDFLVELMAQSRKLLKEHPLNRKRIANGKGEAGMIWLWGQGHSPEFPSYYKRFGLRGGVITAVDLVKGIAIHAGLDVIDVPGVTGYFDTNYVGKAEYALRALKTHDFVAIHVESTDEAGHSGDAHLKIKAIEDVDRLVLGTLRKNLDEFGNYKVMVLPDHFTCVETRTHSRSPVPFFIYQSGKERKGPAQFCERTAKASGILIEEGHTLMEKFIKEAA